MSVLKSIAKGVISIFTGPQTPDVPKPPEIKPPETMPIPDDAQVAQAQRRSILQQRRRSGRTSTIFTDDGLGGNT